MNKQQLNVLLLSKWDDDEDKYVTRCCTEKTYNLSKKEELKKLALDSVNYLAMGYKIELISVSHDFISMISNHKILYIGYTNRFGEYCLSLYSIDSFRAVVCLLFVNYCLLY
jgi:hypothetical protein